MKTFAIAIASAACLTRALAQGPLTPPSGANPAVGPVNALTPGGAPQATMKTLHQVEPRTAIPGGSSTVTLSQPGSYYLTSDITVATGAGIVIAASGVTLDLNGFSIVSTNPSPDWGDLGVGLGYYIKNITIRNGTICGGGAGGKFHTGIGATGFTASANVSVVDVSVSDTVQWGISLDSTSNSRVERCFVETEGVTGAIQARLVNDCSASGGGVYANIVRNSSVRTNGANGIFADVVENSTSTVLESTVPVKTVFKSEPRIPISSLPFTISQSGSYYFTGNLQFTAATGDAITIAASDVTLDLNGFAITSDAGVTGSAIVVSGNRQNIAVRNGSIRGSSALPTLAGFASGIVATTAKNATFERLLIANCRVDGLNSGFESLISHCGANANGGTGLVGGEVVDCVADGNGNGLFASSVIRCFATSNAERGIQAAFAALQSAASRNGGIGILAPGGTVTDCQAYRNGGLGILANGGAVSRSVAERNDAGIQADEGSVSDCVATLNGSHGITANYGTITGCSAKDNRGIGLNAYGGSVSHSNARSNTQHGIYATAGVIAFCTATGNNTSATVPFTDIFPSPSLETPVTRTGNFPTP